MFFNKPSKLALVCSVRTNLKRIKKFICFLLFALLAKQRASLVNFGCLPYLFPFTLALAYLISLN